MAAAAALTLDDVPAVNVADYKEDINSQRMCVIDVPTIYIEATPDNAIGVDRVTSNFRLIEQAKFCEVLDLTREIAPAKNNHVKRIWLKLVDILKPTLRPEEQNSEVQQFVEHYFNRIVNLIEQVDIVDEHVDVSTCGISFDPLRMYVNEESGPMLVSSELTTVGEYSFYSQMPTDDAREEARQLTNDSLLNRLYYCAQHHERTLCFETSYLYNSSLKIMTLAFAYYVLVSLSAPIHRRSSNDLKSHYFSYILDMLIRTRLIKHWQLTSAGQSLLNDVTYNYDMKNPMVKICSLKTVRDRVNYTKQLLNQSPLGRIGDALNYDEYEKCLAENAVSLQGSTYYKFDTKFLTSVFLMSSMENIKTILAKMKDEDIVGF